MIEIEKYNRLKCWVIILSVVVFVLLTILIWLCCSFGVALTAQYAPKDGVWYCEELNLTLSYEADKNSCFLKDGETILCVQTGHPQNKHVYVYAAEEIVLENGSTILQSTILLFQFEISQLKYGYFIAHDNLNAEYMFVRKE